MAAKGYPGRLVLRAKPEFPPSMAVRIYLLAAVFAALAGCAADIRETEPNFAVHAHVTLNHGASATLPGILISSIRRTDKPGHAFTPSPSALDLWLHAGDYEATIVRCDEPADDQTRDLGSKQASALGPDHLFKFSVETNQLYHFYCSTSVDGKIYVELYNVIEIFID